MASSLERSMASLRRWRFSVNPSRPVSVRTCYVDGGLYHLDEGGPKRKRDPNDPRRAQIPGGPKLGVDSHQRVPWTYGSVKPHYHVFRQLWGEPTLLKRKLGVPEEDVKRLAPPVDKVQVPIRKKRSSTAVLEALSSTVRVSPNTVPYDLIDDPYLLPASYPDSYLLRQSRAMGRRVARRIVEDHPYFFDYDFFRPDPVIPAFEPLKDWVFEDGEAGFDEAIRERLNAERYDLAFQLFYEARNNDIKLDEDILVRLFHVAASKNFSGDVDSLRPSEAPDPDENYGRMHIRDMALGPSPPPRPNIWNSDGVAEDLWRRIKKTDALHCALVKALVAHGDVQRAWAHFQSELVDEDRVIDSETFHALLKHGHEIPATEGAELPFELLFKLMAARGIQPSVDTFNAAMYSVLCLGGLQSVAKRRLIETILAEMIALRVPPTLGTFGLLIKSHRIRRTNIRGLLHWILDAVERLKIEPRDELDGIFFPLAMRLLRTDVAGDSPSDALDIAQRLIDLGCRGDLAPIFVGSHDVRNSCLEDHLYLATECGTLSQAMSLFDAYSPAYLIFGPSNWRRFFERLSDLAPIKSDYLARICNDLTRVGSKKDMDVYAMFSSFFVQPSADDAEKVALAEVAFAFFTRNAYALELLGKRTRREVMIVGADDRQTDGFQYNHGPAYDNILTAICAASDLGKAEKVYSHYRASQKKVVGAPPIDGAAKLFGLLVDAPATWPRRVETMIDVMRLFDDLGARRHLEGAVDLMMERVSLDADSAVVVSLLKEELKPKKKKN